MTNLKKISYITGLILIFSKSFASFSVSYPLGDNITFKNVTWNEIEPLYTAWSNVGELTNCANFRPLASTVDLGSVFLQTLDCQQEQVRSRQNREQENGSLVIRNIGSPIKEEKNITISTTLESIGTKENWVTTGPLYGDFVNIKRLYNCTNWLPQPPVGAETSLFSQSSTNCMTDVSQSVQDREQETHTLEYRNIGDPYTIYKTLTNQTVTRRYFIDVGPWVPAGGGNLFRARFEGYDDHLTNERIYLIITNDYKPM